MKEVSQAVIEPAVQKTISQATELSHHCNAFLIVTSGSAVMLELQSSMVNVLSEVDDAFVAIDAHSHKDVVILPLQIEVTAVDNQNVSETTLCFIIHNVVIVSPTIC